MRSINAQHHTMSCGPVALANAIKWLGTETSYREMMRFCQATGQYMPGIGMSGHQMKWALRAMKVPVRHCYKFNVKELDRLLDLGRAVIMIYATSPWATHAVFIDARTKKRYRVWNRVKNRGPWYSRRCVIRDINRRPGLFKHSYVIVLRKDTSPQK